MNPQVFTKVDFSDFTQLLEVDYLRLDLSETGLLPTLLIEIILDLIGWR